MSRWPKLAPLWGALVDRVVDPRIRRARRITKVHESGLWELSYVYLHRR